VLGILAALALIAVVLLFVADNRYEFLFASPRKSHSTYVNERTSILAVVNPAHAVPLILDRLGENAPPQSVLAKLLPYEAALLISPDVRLGPVDVTLFVNTRRLAPVIAEQSVHAGIPQAVPFVTWTSTGFQPAGAGVLTMTGITDIDRATLGEVRAEWGVVTLPSRPSIDGSHMLEAIIDNRDGTLYAVVSALAAKNLIELPVAKDEIRKTVAPVAIIRATGDLSDVETLSIRMTVECQATAEEGQVTAVSFTLGALLSELAKALQQAYGASLTIGQKTTDGTIITIDCTLRNFRAII
jgi:hypothetical protein